MNRNSLRIAAPAAALALAFGLSACGAANEPDDSGSKSTGTKVSGTLNGAGATSQEAAIAAWKKGFQTSNPDVTVNYDPSGSGGGREQFIAGGVQFAGTDSYLEDEEVKAATAKCGSDIVEVPVYVSPIAVIYNLDGVDELNLSANTVGQIFEGKITKWNDPAIKADNPDAKLPDSDITPVHRSDDSGTTKNFTDYLDKASDGGWTKGAVETWAVKGGEGASGTSGVVAAVKGGKGTIGYADESQAGDLGQAKIKVGDGVHRSLARGRGEGARHGHAGRGSRSDGHRRRRRPQDGGGGRLPDRPRLLPGRLPDPEGRRHRRSRQGLADLRRQH